jgi:DNA ligase (NAD+)
MQHSNHNDEITNLVQLGFAINPLNKIFNNIQDAYKYSEYISVEREKLNYPIDGSVIKLNNNDEVNTLGIVGKTPRAWCAIKFSPDEVTTILTNITYQVGRTGKITPVAELEAVLLQGTTVKRASLHNYKEVLDYDIHYNDTVIVRKAGDIIPEIVKLLPALRQPNTNTIPLPIHCPSCNTELTLSTTGIDLMCDNRTHCPEQIKFRLSYFCSRNIANITGLSDKTLEKFVSEYNIRTIADIYSLDFTKITDLEGFGSKSVENLTTSIDKAKQLQDYKFITGLSIEGIGIENSKLIANLIDNTSSN